MKSLYAFAALVAVPVTAVSAQAPMTPASYMMKAGAGDQYEIQSSKLLLQSTTNPKLKQFADMMVMDHMKSTADVKMAATAARLKAPVPRLDAKGAADMAALRRARGTQRDMLYVTQQKMSHDKALALHQGYANAGTITPLRDAAARIVPVVETHRTELAGM